MTGFEGPGAPDRHQGQETRLFPAPDEQDENPFAFHDSFFDIDSQEDQRMQNIFTEVNNEVNGNRPQQSFTKSQDGKMAQREEYDDAEVPKNKKGESVFKKPDVTDNSVSWAIWKQLNRCYTDEKGSWTPKMVEEVLETAQKTTIKISKTNGEIGAIRVGRVVKDNKFATWTQFFILRVMFGGDECARQPWFGRLQLEYPQALRPAPPGVIPENYQEILMKGLRCPLPKKGLKIPTTYPATQQQLAHRPPKRKMGEDVPDSEASSHTTAQTKLTKRLSNGQANKPGKVKFEGHDLSDAEWENFERAPIKVRVQSGTSLDGIQDKLARHDRSIDKLRATNERLRDSNMKLEEDNAGLRANIEGLVKAMDKLTGRVNTLRKKFEDFTK
ncbi:hypothetical protein PT974_07297 [Cladobotryum mycophilum]|uniref:Uncharacterized protein n=1 Tax=Cladobotryum mycophilum TaxID=491253 RepID=A0ABR0SQ62_9HYPO